MNLIKQNGPFCLATSCAMILGISLEQVHEELGHDGTEIWFPPTGMRGVHIQEIKKVCFNHGVALMSVDRNPMSAPNEYTVPRELYTQTKSVYEFANWIFGRKAIIIIPGHAVAWDGRDVYDPKGFVKSLQFYDFIIEAYIAFTI